jgi:hypothetical protein
VKQLLAKVGTTLKHLTASSDWHYITHFTAQADELLSMNYKIQLLSTKPKQTRKMPKVLLDTQFNIQVALFIDYDWNEIMHAKDDAMSCD